MSGALLGSRARDFAQSRGRGVPSDDEDFLSRLQMAALRARASGFIGTAAAIEAIIRREIERRAVERGSNTGEAGSRTPGDDR